MTRTRESIIESQRMVVSVLWRPLLKLFNGGTSEDTSVARLYGSRHHFTKNERRTRHKQYHGLLKIQLTFSSPPCPAAPPPPRALPLPSSPPSILDRCISLYGQHCSRCSCLVPRGGPWPRCGGNAGGASGSLSWHLLPGWGVWKVIVHASCSRGICLVHYCTSGSAFFAQNNLCLAGEL